MPRQEFIDGPDAIENTLGVVEALDTNAHIGLFGNPKFSTDATPALINRRLILQCVRRPFDRNGIGANDRFMSAERN